MKYKTKLGAASLTLAAFISGCAPMAGTTAPQTTSSIPAAGSYTAPTGSAYNTGATTYDYNTGSTASNAGASYYDYGTGGATTTATTTPSSGYDNYYATGSNTGTTSSTYYDYSAGSTGAASSNGSVSGSYAVQVVASPNRSTAESMLGQMQSMGFTATIDQVGGLYKVRVPYASESEAKANLSRIRSSVPDAFFTVR
ncbi:MAG: SPOR domain-containing protein [Gammaproteobacteria bacterium]|nr:SPOR domain-containing protein [Gammaproteobacteria bacterium]MBU1723218.1 SPOR domain-containing protein [Gammaproteobacteria bacterium]MBU2007243.1 SPOR domain-containing protein [Gammaproteobacteria bacterium]